MKSSFGNSLDKKIPESKKYAHIGSNIDTGASAKKQQVVSASMTAKRRDEIFKRIKAATLARLLQEHNVVETVYAMGSDSNSAAGLSASSVVASKGPPTTAAPTVASIGSIAGSVVSIVDSDTTVDESRDLVLLDLRESAEYEQCHLPLAISYPAEKINRDQFPPELHRCKRDPSKLLVVYHADDQATAGVAKLLVQKGWESVHALSGGFEEMAQNYSEVLEGQVPERLNTGSTLKSGSSRQTKLRP